MMPKRTFVEVENLFRDLLCDILELPLDNKQTVFSYQATGVPGWKHDQDKLFIRLNELDDEYAKFRSSLYHPNEEAVIKSTSRTRVWEVYLIAYGPHACDVQNQIKDGVFLQKARRFYFKNDIALITDYPQALRVPELFNGRWWERWDMRLRFNELYVVEEDVGSIEDVQIFVNEPKEE